MSNVQELYVQHAGAICPTCRSYMSNMQELYAQRAGAIYPIRRNYMPNKQGNNPLCEDSYFTSSHVSVRNGKALSPKVLRKVIFPA